MKIGAFAKRHNVSQDTIRHYLDIQLLLTEKVGTQYNFTEEDSEDMEEILGLKSLKFSLSEIQNIISYKRLASNKTMDFRNHFKDFLEKKREEIEFKQKEIERTKTYIETKIYELELEERNKLTLGIPIIALTFLVCPHCKRELSLSEGNIENNMVISGKIACVCNYALIVDNGIIVNEKSIRDKNIPTKAAYYEKTSPEFINFVFKGMTNLIRLIESKVVNKKYIIEFGRCGGFFLMQYLPYLPKDSTYIIVDYDLKRLKQIKNNLELNHNHNNFLFLCCNNDELPLVDNFIDLVIQDSVVELNEENRENLLIKTIVPLIKAGGYLACKYPYFEVVNKHICSPYKETIDFYNKNNILNMLKTTSLNVIDIKEIGPAYGAGEYDPYIEGSNYYHLVYMGRKDENLK